MFYGCWNFKVKGRTEVEWWEVSCCQKKGMLNYFSESQQSGAGPENNLHCDVYLWGHNLTIILDYKHSLDFDFSHMKKARHIVPSVEGGGGGFSFFFLSFGGGWQVPHTTIHNCLHRWYHSWSVYQAVFAKLLWYLLFSWIWSNANFVKLYRFSLTLVSLY